MNNILTSDLPCGDFLANSGKSFPPLRLRGPGRPKQFAKLEEERLTHPRGLRTTSKRAVNQSIRRGSILGDDLKAVVGTSLDKGVELDALTRLEPAVRAVLIAWAAAGEKVSARDEFLVALIRDLIAGKAEVQA